MEEVRKQVKKISRFGLNYELQSILKKKGIIHGFTTSALIRHQSFYEHLDPNGYRVYLLECFRWNMGYEMDIERPISFCEKIQWMKLFDNLPIKTKLADKYLVRDWVTERIGSRHVVPIIGVWDDATKVDFGKLPLKCILKCNHGSGMNLVIDKKTGFDEKLVVKQLNEWMKLDFSHFSGGFEMQYTDIPRRIIAEPFLDSISKAGLIDYKIHCFMGEPVFIQVIGDRNLEHHTGFQANYDFQWNKMEWIFEDYPLFPYSISRPESLDEMYGIAKKLCEGFRYVRVDLYDVKGQVLFGEMTFTPASGFYPHKGTWTIQRDWELGAMIRLPIDER